MANLKGLGGRGEELACQFLTDSGFFVIERNFISRFGEIDIIARKENYICFVEVKAREPKKNFASGFEAVDFIKQQKIVKTAEYFLLKHKQFSKLQPRFDCVQVDVDKGSGEINISHIENAFDL